MKVVKGGIMFVDVVMVPGIEPMCETFCKVCGDLRLWCRPEKPLACGGCGAPGPMIGPIGGEELSRLRDAWESKSSN
jgi:hypothetical protein